MNENTNTYSRKEMEERLPDYVFGRIEDSERIAFEGSLHLYPDIETEISEVRNVFSKLEMLNFDGIATQRTKNLSVKVTDRLLKSRQRRNYSPFSLRFIIPAAALLVLAVYIFYFPKSGNPAGNEQQTGVQSAVKPLNILSQSDIAVIFDSTVTRNEIAGIRGGEEGIVEVENQDDMASIIDDFISDQVVETLSKEDIKKLSGMPGIGYDILDNLDSMDEDEFQSLLKELENVKIGV